jgi:hypothetical protein
LLLHNVGCAAEPDGVAGCALTTISDDSVHPAAYRYLVAVTNPVPVPLLLLVKGIRIGAQPVIWKLPAAVVVV